MKILSLNQSIFFLSISGEPFTQEEIDEMLSAAVDPDKGTVLYKDYASLMTIDEL